MRKKWAIVLCFVVVSIGTLVSQQMSANSPEQGIAKASGGHKRKEQPEGYSDNGSSPNPVSVSQKPATPGSNQARQDSSEDRHIQRWLMYFTGALVGVGFLQVVSMIWQAYLLRGTMKQLQRQVTAQMDATNPLIIAVPKNAIRAAAFFMFDWIPVNAGQTAAFIVETNTHFAAFASLDDIPAIPVYRETVDWSQEPILPGKEGNGDGVALVTAPKTTTDEIGSLVEAGSVRLFAYGRIRYRDIYQRAHETRFGFVWFPEDERFEAGGPDQYNQYT